MYLEIEHENNKLKEKNSTLALEIETTNDQLELFKTALEKCQSKRCKQFLFTHLTK